MKILRYFIPILTIAFTLSASGCADSFGGGDGRTLYSYTLTQVSGNNQTVTPDSTESDPIVVRVDMNESPASGITVKWTITEGGGSLSSDSGVSGGDGQVQTTYKSGNTTGDVKIRATVDFDSSGFERFAGREVTPVTFTVKVTD
jgi:hypothetical protein